MVLRRVLLNMFINLLFHLVFFFEYAGALFVKLNHDHITTRPKWGVRAVNLGQQNIQMN